MLAVSPLISNNGREGEMENFSIDFDEFSCGNLLDDINFDDIFIGIGEGDVLPDLEMDSDMLAEFSLSGGEDSEFNQSFSDEKVDESGKLEEDDTGSGTGSGSGLTSTQGEEIVSKRHESVRVNSSSKDSHKGHRKSSKSSHSKRKMKVDWTPELHRRFVQAVEQLGMDKAVPSRILELMGIDCLTRHNIASHLQKYRSHQKHLRAREAEAASWNQRRQIYGGGSGSKRDMAPWPTPTMGFPPPAAPLPSYPRPLHVWGHPAAVDKSLMHMWPKHLAHSPSAAHRPPWTPPPPSYPPYCHPPHQIIHPNTFRSTHAPHPTRFPSHAVPGILPPHAMYKVDQGNGVTGGHSRPHPPFDFHPSKESIDAAIGDVLSKPWQPLPLGLKPPSVDSVMGELQRQGVPKIPPAATAGA